VRIYFTLGGIASVVLCGGDTAKVIGGVEMKHRRLVECHILSDARLEEALRLAADYIQQHSLDIFWNVVVEENQDGLKTWNVTLFIPSNVYEPPKKWE
jgi:hypothetical protein